MGTRSAPCRRARQHIQTVHAWQAQVQQDQVPRALCLRGPQARQAIGLGLHLGRQLGQVQAQQLRHVGLVFHDQHAAQ